MKNIKGVVIVNKNGKEMNVTDVQKVAFLTITKIFEDNEQHKAVRMINSQTRGLQDDINDEDDEDTIDQLQEELNAIDWAMAKRARGYEVKKGIVGSALKNLKCTVDYRTKCKELEKELEEVKDENEQLLDAAEELLEQRDALNEHCADLKKQIAELTKQLEDLTAPTVKPNATVKDNKKRTEKLLQQIEAGTPEFDS